MTFWHRGDDLSTDEISCVTSSVDGLDSDFNALSLDEQVVAFEALIDCAPEAARGAFVGGILNADDADDLLGAAGPEVGECLFDAIAVEDADQTNRIAAMVYIGEDLPAPPEAVQPGAEMMAQCFDFGSILNQLFLGDPEFADAIDPTCVETTFDEETTTELFAVLLADPDAFDSDTPPESFLQIFDCFQFGELFAAELAPAAILSEEEITCINEAFRGPEVIQSFSDGGDLPAEALSGLFTCLEPENLAALGAQ